MWLWHTFVAIIVAIVIVVITLGVDKTKRRGWQDSLWVCQVGKSTANAWCVCVGCIYIYIYIYIYMYVWVCVLRVTHLDQSNTRLVSSQYLFVKIKRRSTIFCRSPHIDRRWHPPGSVRLPQIRQSANFTAANFSLSRAFNVSLGCDIHASRTGERSAKRHARYEVDVSSLASVTITRSPHATRYPIVCYYSCITRYRRVHVVPFARSIICVGRRDVKTRRLLARIVPDDERRRLYIKIAVKVGRPRYHRFLAFKGL